MCVFNGVRNLSVSLAIRMTRYYAAAYRFLKQLSVARARALPFDTSEVEINDCYSAHTAAALIPRRAMRFSSLWAEGETRM